MTSLPRYGFSSRPAASGLTSSGIADLWHQLMRDGLGYARFGAHGTDIGASVTTRLGWRHPGSVTGIHLSAISFASPPPPWSPAERDYPAATARCDEDEGAYSQIQSTKPATLASGLNHSHGGAAGLDRREVPCLERLRRRRGVPLQPRTAADQPDHLLGDADDRVVGPALHQQRRHGGGLPPGTRVELPAGFAIFAGEFVPAGCPPRELAERTYR